MTPRINQRALRSLLLLLTLCLSACANSSKGSAPPSVVLPARIPPLSAQARQPAIPSECSPTCSSALTVERESWLNTLTELE
ncbi:hypothetical protein QTI68_09525 [Variovorax sp. J31P207]|nr:hypothetical protein [Variovorax sp. J31P207]MDM0066782.1 hypothetical protein [Variovorax sp. J31P207]